MKFSCPKTTFWRARLVPAPPERARESIWEGGSGGIGRALVKKTVPARVAAFPQRTAQAGAGGQVSKATSSAG